MRLSDSLSRRGHPHPSLRGGGRLAGSTGSAECGLPPSRDRAGVGTQPLSSRRVGERSEEGSRRRAPLSLPPAGGRSHAKLREGSGGCGLGYSAAPGLAVAAHGAALQPGHSAPAAFPGEQRDLLRVLCSPAQPRRGKMVSPRPGPFCWPRLLPAPAALLHAALSAPQACGGCPPGQLARQHLSGHPWGNFPVSDRE